MGPAPNTERVGTSGTGAADGLTVASVARRLGVAPATLRTWDRRYGVGPSVHQAGSHRRYDPDDLVRLQGMRRLVLAGMSPSAAAARVLSQTPSVDAAEPEGAAPTAARLDSAEGGAEDSAEGGAAPREAGRRRAVRAGQVPATRAAPAAARDAAVRGLSRAVRALDSDTVVRVLRASLATDGVLPTWESLLRPVLVDLGERWAATGDGVDAEHLVSDCAGLALREWGLRHVPPLGSTPALLACAPRDRHSLPLFALAAALAERQVGARVLGATVPAKALADAVRRIGPGAVFIWSQLPETADPASVTELPRMRPAPLVLLGGAGWGFAPLPAGAQASDSFADAVERIAGLLAPV